MRNAKIIRETGETQITVNLDLDKGYMCKVNTGVGFLDHMLNLFAKYANVSLSIEAKGDFDVDNHHTIEDIGIVLGQCLAKALGDKKGINRYGSATLPMDETLMQIDLDLSGRSFLVFNCDFEREFCGNLETEMVEEFFRALSFNALMTLHINKIYGKNTHHIIEAIFKGFGFAIKAATSKNANINGVLSTKGVL